MFCSECGEVIADTAKECPKCGHVFPFNADVNEAPAAEEAPKVEPQPTTSTTSSSTSSTASSSTSSTSTSSYSSSYSNSNAGTEPMAIIAMILGIVAVLLSCVYGIGALIGIAGLVLGIIGKKRTTNYGTGGGGMAVVGIVLSAVAMVIGFCFVGIVGSQM